MTLIIRSMNSISINQSKLFMMLCLRKVSFTAMIFHVVLPSKGMSLEIHPMNNHLQFPNFIHPKDLKVLDGTSTMRVEDKIRFPVLQVRKLKDRR